MVGPWLKGPVPAIAELATASIAALVAERELLPASGEIETAGPFRGVTGPAFWTPAAPDPLAGDATATASGAAAMGPTGVAAAPDPFAGDATAAMGPTGVVAAPDPLARRTDRRGERRRRDGADRSGQGHRGPVVLRDRSTGTGNGRCGGGAGCAGPELAAPAVAGGDRP